MAVGERRRGAGWVSARRSGLWPKREGKEREEVEGWAGSEKKENWLGGRFQPKVDFGDFKWIPNFRKYNKIKRVKNK